MVKLNQGSLSQVMKSKILGIIMYRFVFKQIKQHELKMFKEMGFSYFEYLCKSFCHFCPTALAKKLGAFKVKIRYLN